MMTNLLPDFAGVITAPLKKMIDVVIVSFQSFMLGLGANAEHCHAINGFR